MSKTQIIIGTLSGVCLGGTILLFRRELKQKIKEIHNDIYNYFWRSIKLDKKKDDITIVRVSSFLMRNTIVNYLSNGSNQYKIANGNYNCAVKIGNKERICWFTFTDTSLTISMSKSARTYDFQMFIDDC